MPNYAASTFTPQEFQTIASGFQGGGGGIPAAGPGGVPDMEALTKLTIANAQRKRERDEIDAARRREQEQVQQAMEEQRFLRSMQQQAPERDPIADRINTAKAESLELANRAAATPRARMVRYNAVAGGLGGYMNAPEGGPGTVAGGYAQPGEDMPGIPEKSAQIGDTRTRLDDERDFALYANRGYGELDRLSRGDAAIGSSGGGALTPALAAQQAADAEEAKRRRGGR